MISITFLTDPISAFVLGIESIPYYLGIASISKLHLCWYHSQIQKLLAYRRGELNKEGGVRGRNIL